MCFNLVNLKETVPQIAKENINVYKIMKFDFHILTSRFFASKCPEEGFSFFVRYKALDDEKHPILKLELLNSEDGLDWSIKDGFHSYSYVKALSWLDNAYSMVECIIPQGAEFYYNPYEQEYVSTEIIFFAAGRTFPPKL